MTASRDTRTWQEQRRDALGWTEPLYGPPPPSREIEEPIEGQYPFIRRWCERTGEPMPSFAERLRQAELECEAWFIGRDRIPEADDSWDEEHEEELRREMMEHYR